MVSDPGSANGERAPRRVRSLLWVGDTAAGPLEAALAGSAADLVVADLEDTVAGRRKHEVRELLRETIAARAEDPQRRALFVRPNPLDTSLGRADLAVLAEAGVDGLVVPKATPEVLALARAAGVARLVALIETAEGVERAGESARCPGVELIELGAMDLALELRTEAAADGHDLLYTRSRLAIASRAAGLPGPVDAIFPDLHDSDGYLRAAARGRALGFAGMPCLSEDQVLLANEFFTPDPDAVERAGRIVAAYDGAVARGEGVVEVDGSVVERPTAERARIVLQEAGVSA
ncbi:MAG: CoA ester lyase [Actinobacteria bacterium]|nr:CoA ester lyase [Actinomycetota bacterium]